MSFETRESRAIPCGAGRVIGPRVPTPGSLFSSVCTALFDPVVFSCTSTTSVVFFQAFAKQHGSYEAISGGHVCEAFEALTGAPTETVMLGGLRLHSPPPAWKCLPRKSNQLL